jgi:SNF2 family DNA or RNA helicase
VFYNFHEELETLKGLCDALERPVSVINGAVKDLSAYEQNGDSITLVQYQAGAMGLNLQLANKIVYFTLPDGRQDLFDQSMKRVHRIGQNRTCFYYILLCRDSVEEDILKTLNIRKEYTDELFKEGE